MSNKPWRQTRTIAKDVAIRVATSNDFKITMIAFPLQDGNREDLEQDQGYRKYKLK